MRVITRAYESVFRRRLPTTSAGVEMALVVAFLGFRLVNLAQLLTSLPLALSKSPRPNLDVALAGLFAAETGLAAMVALRRSSLRSRALVWGDVACAAVVLLGQAQISRPVDRMGSWTAWGYAVTLSTALLAGMVLPRRREALAAVCLLVACYLAVTLPVVAGNPGTALTNATAYLAFAGVGWGFAGYLRRLGGDADAARAEAAKAAARAETERHRRLLHDQATVLHLLSQDLREPSLEAALRRQAATGAGAIAAFLSGSAGTASAGALGEVVRSVVARFPDLPVTTNADLADHVCVPAEVTSALQGALTTLLHNVRRHARATACVVHADADPLTGAWEVVVRDDGVGFDPAATRWGYSLAQQVR